MVIIQYFQKLLEVIEIAGIRSPKRKLKQKQKNNGLFGNAKMGLFPNYFTKEPINI